MTAARRLAVTLAALLLGARAVERGVEAAVIRLTRPSPRWHIP